MSKLRAELVRGQQESLVRGKAVAEELDALRKELRCIYLAATLFILRLCVGGCSSIPII